MTSTVINEIDPLAKRYSTLRKGLSLEEQLRLVAAIVRANEKPAPGTTPRRPPKGYLTLAHAATSLDSSMWASFGTAELAEEHLRKFGETGKRAAGFAPRRAHVWAALEAAFYAGKLTLYVALDEACRDKRFNPMPAWAKSPRPVPRRLIRYAFIGAPGRMSGIFAVRPPRKVVGDDRLFAFMECGQLLVKESEFKRWLRLERKKRRWPSQQIVPCARNPVGRPSKLDKNLRTAILVIVAEQTWNGEQPLTELQRRLSEKRVESHSLDTLGRIVDRLFSETGKAALRRRHRIRRR